MLLVTGITGLTGRFLFYEIERDGKIGHTRCLVRRNSDISWMNSRMPELCFGDVGNVEDLVDAMKGVSGVIHLVNIRYSPQIIEACKKAGIKRVIIVTTTGMYSRYQIYSRIYRKLEEVILNSGLDYTIIRPTMIYGNHLDKNIHKLVKLMNKLPVFPVVGNGKSFLQPIYAADLAKVVYTAFKSNKSMREEYNVSGKEPISYIDMLKELASVLGKEPVFFHVPYALALIAGKIGDLIPNGLIDYEKIQRLSENKAFDHIKARNDLGFNPMSFQDGIKLEVEALRGAGVI